MAWYGKDPNDGEIARVEAAKKDLQESKAVHAGEYSVAGEHRQVVADGPVKRR